MTDTLVIAPVKKTISVRAGQTHCFEVFTAGIGRWWPRNWKIGKAALKTPVIEPRAGGRWYELGEDGSECPIGRILAWEPPDRLVVTWDINSQWQPDTVVNSEVEIRFIAEGPDTTRVELEHRKFERMGAERGAAMRKSVDNGWPQMLEHFRTEAEAGTAR
jgi:uncharacterized protein YndB with AHSA1/START domain